MVNKNNKRLKNKSKIQKIMQNSHKNDFFHSNFDKIYNNFCNWLIGIVEDTPIPREAKNIYFIVEFNQNDIVLSFSADEKNLSLFDYGTFFPLEGEYFLCKEIRQLASCLFIKKSISKTDVLDMLKTVASKAKTELDFLYSKNIFIGERFSKIFV